MLDITTQQSHTSTNLIHTVVLLVGIGAILGISTVLLFGWTGLLVTVVSLCLLVICARRMPADIIMRLYNGQLVDPQSRGQLTRIVDVLSQRAEISHRPKLYIIPSLSINAFAVGHADHAAIGLTEGLLRRLTMRETTGIMAHEISHIRNDDLSVLGQADLVSRFTQLLAYAAALLAVINFSTMILRGEAIYSWYAIALLYLAPAMSSLLQLGLSRVREFDADLKAAQLTGDPEALESALIKVERHTGHFWEDFMFPVPGRRVPQPSVLRSHPASERRIAGLRDLDAQSILPQIAVVEEPMFSLVGFGPIELRPRHRFPGLWY
ncbi:MAG: zinc metalloprotease HtpX [Hyphomicrobiaceae bacterium]